MRLDKCSTPLGVVFLFFFFSATAQAQPPVRAGIDLGAAFGEPGVSPTILYHQTLQKQGMGPLFIGWGLRFWGFYASETRLSAPVNGSLSDSLLAGRSRSNGIHLVFSAGVRLGKVAELGVNADLLGIAFGPRYDARYRMALPGSAPDSIAALNNTDISIAPRFMNLNPAFSPAYNGQNEAFLRLWLGRQIALKLSYVVGRRTFTADQPLYNEQRQFSSFYGMPQASLTIPLFTQ
jgi:hypothetical protein